MALYCEKCGAPLEIGSRFCVNCGSAVATSVGRTEAAHRPVDCCSYATAEPKAKRQGWLTRLFGHKTASSQAAYHVEAGEEVTVIFDRPPGEGGLFDADDSTTVLSSELQVFLERQSGGKSFSHPLPFVVGKGSAADVQIAGNPTVSRRHARFFSQGGEAMIEDLGSTNKTKVNGVVVAQGARVQLSDGDVLQLSDEVFTVHIRRP